MGDINRGSKSYYPQSFSVKGDLVLKEGSYLGPELVIFVNNNKDASMKSTGSRQSSK